MLTSIQPFLTELSKTILGLTDDEKAIIKDSKGAGGPVKAYNALRVALNRNYPAFTNPELEAYILENCTDHNPEAADLLNRLLAHLRQKIADHYSNENEWLVNYVPEGLRNSIVSTQAIDRLRGSEREGWDYLSFKDIADLATYKTNWSSFFKSLLFIEGVSEKRGEATAWLDEMGSFHESVKANRHLINSHFQRIVGIAHAYGIDVA